MSTVTIELSTIFLSLPFRMYDLLLLHSFTVFLPVRVLIVLRRDKE